MSYFFFILIASCSNTNEGPQQITESKQIFYQNKSKVIPIHDQLIQWTSYELVETPQSYQQAISALGHKAEHSGFEGITRYSFYVDEETGLAGAIIIYDSPQAFIDWHELVLSFPEYETFKKTVKLKDLKFYGNLPFDLKKSLEDRKIPFEYIGQFAGGFMK
jgi:hypothetical protein